MSRPKALRIPVFVMMVLASSIAVAGAPDPNAVKAALAEGRGVSGMVVADGFKAIDLERGYGEPAQTGAWVRFNYTGWLQDPKAPDGKGEKFDSSQDRGEPFVFQLGKQRVILGWDAGIVGMRSGGKRRLVIPPALGFGDKGAGAKGSAKAIPPNATLVFEVEMIDFLPAIVTP
jgi:FKBP-type peptidyl-prolyl cis-trans isomerase FkpA